jgi:hypothetical protein
MIIDSRFTVPEILVRNCVWYCSVLAVLVSGYLKIENKLELRFQT